MGYPRPVKRPLGSPCGVTALLTWGLIPQLGPADLSTWDWDAAQPVDNISDHLSAVHLTEDGVLIGLDDDGWVVRVSSLVGAAPAGGWPRSPLEGGGDLEGLCAAGDSDLLVLLEDRCELVRVDRRGDRVGRHTLSAEIPRGGQGLEGLARVPAADGTATLWLGHQGTSKVYVVQAPRDREDSGPLELLNTLDLGDEARGMVFDPGLNAVLMVVDEAREIWLVDPEGAIRDRRPWPKGTRDMEGVTHGPFGALLLALDGGGVWSIPPRQFRVPGAWRLTSSAAALGAGHGQEPLPSMPLSLEADGLAGRIEDAQIHLQVAEGEVERWLESPLALTPGARVLGAALCARRSGLSPARPTWVLGLIEEGPAGHALSLHELKLQGDPSVIRMQRRGLVLLGPWARIGARERAGARAPLLLWSTADQGVLCAAAPPSSRAIVLVRAPLDAQPEVIGAVALDFECYGLERPDLPPPVLLARGSEQRLLLEISPPAKNKSGSEHEGDR